MARNPHRRPIPTDYVKGDSGEYLRDYYVGVVAQTFPPAMCDFDRKVIARRSFEQAEAFLDERQRVMAIEKAESDAEEIREMPTKDCPKCGKLMIRWKVPDAPPTMIEWRCGCGYTDDEPHYPAGKSDNELFREIFDAVQESHGN